MKHNPSPRGGVLAITPPPPPCNGPTPPTPKADPDVNCPRCHTVLTDPHGIGLCPRCGFCRSLQAEGANVLATSFRVGRWEPIVRGLKHALRVSPPAFVAIGVALGVVIPMALTAERHFAPGSRERALWSGGHLLSGVLLLLAGQAWAVALLKQMRERVNWTDMASPLHLWGLALRRLPTTAWPVGLGGSGLLAIIAALFWVGGLSYWFSLYPSREDKDAYSRAAAARRQDSGDEVQLARVARVLGLRGANDEAKWYPQSDAPSARPSSFAAPSTNATGSASAAAVDSRPTERCVIVGVVPATAGQAPGLVLATLREGQLAFAGVVRTGASPNASLLDRISKLGRSRPLLDGLNLEAVWVKPEMFCEVHQSGIDPNGQLIDPKLKGLIED